MSDAPNSLDSWLRELLQQQTGHEFRAEVWDETIAAINKTIMEARLDEIKQAQKVKYIQHDMPVHLNKRATELELLIKKYGGAE